MNYTAAAVVGQFLLLRVPLLFPFVCACRCRRLLSLAAEPCEVLAPSLFSGTCVLACQGACAARRAGGRLLRRSGSAAPLTYHQLMESLLSPQSPQSVDSPVAGEEKR